LQTVLLFNFLQMMVFFALDQAAWFR
jgi:hypothetical protein